MMPEANITKQPPLRSHLELLKSCHSLTSLAPCESDPFHSGSWHKLALAGLKMMSTQVKIHLVLFRKVDNSIE